MNLFQHRGEPDPSLSRQRKPGETRGRKKGSTPWNKGKSTKKKSLWKRAKQFIGIKDNQPINNFQELILESQQQFEDIMDLNESQQLIDVKSIPLNKSKYFKLCLAALRDTNLTNDIIDEINNSYNGSGSDIVSTVFNYVMFNVFVNECEKNKILLNDYYNIYNDWLKSQKINVDKFMLELFEKN